MRKIIFCDVDGILYDYVGAACELHGLDPKEAREWNWYRRYGITDEEFWRKINLLGDRFYGSFVRKYRWADYLVDSCAEMGDVVFLTSNPETGDLGKCKRLKKDWPNIPIITCIGESATLKSYCARPNTILIDDNKENVFEFSITGARGVLFKQPWNGGEPNVEKTLQKVRKWAAEQK